jgi:hypothetical protein
MDFLISKPNLIYSKFGEEINHFLDSMKTSHPFQYPIMGNIIEEVHGNIIYFIGRKKGNIILFGIGSIGHLPRIKSIKHLIFNYGPVCDDYSALIETALYLKNVYKIEKYSFINIKPYWYAEESINWRTQLINDGWLENRQGGVMSSLRINLLQSDEDLLKSFRGTTRYEIRRAQKLGVEIKQATSEKEAELFCMLYTDMFKNKNIEPGDMRVLDSLTKSLINEKERAVILLAFYEGRPMGGVIIGRAGKHAVYLWGGTKKDTKIVAGKILQYHGMLWARDLGCCEYDMGGYREAHPVATFKKGFSAKVVKFSPGFRYILNRNRFRLYQVCDILKRGIIRLSLNI